MSDLISRQAAIMDAESWVAVDEYEKNLQKKVVEWLKEFQPAELGTNLAEVGTDCISRQAAIDICANAIDLWRGQLGEGALIAVRDKIKELPPAQQNLSEEYAKTVRNWLVNYQIKCAELKGRYTPYEVLGWIVSDWRKENGIW